MSEMLNITLENIAALATPGRHNLLGTLTEGPEQGKYFDCYLINHSNYELTMIAADRSEKLAEARPANSAEEVKGYLITYTYSVNKSPKRFYGLIVLTDRTKVISICETIASLLENKKYSEAFEALKVVALEVHQS